MAIRASHHKESAGVDLEAIGSRKDSIDDADIESIDERRVSEATEEGARFLPLEIDPEPIVRPSKPTQRYVILMCAQFLFMVEVSQFIMEPPLQEIMEDFICHARYADHAMGKLQVQDPRCKEPGVQGDLAMTRSWMAFVGMLVPLLVQIPYGIIADKYGRRPVLFLGLLGVVLMALCNTIVLLHPDVFSTWHLILGAIPTLIGGGAPAITAMIWTILTDTVPADERTTLFYQMHAMMLILSAVCRPIAGWLLSIDPWLPMWIGLVALVLSMFSTLLIPETLQLQNAAESKHGGDSSPRLYARSRYGAIKAALITARKDLGHIGSSLFKSKNLMLLMTGYGLCFPIFIAFEMNLLQYVTARFNWEWSTAAYITTVSKVTSVIVLLAILPLCSYLITKRSGLQPLARDLFLARGSVIFLVAGNFLTAISAAPWLLVISLVVLSFGSGFYPQIRALLAGFVEADTLATLNTFISTLETIMGLFSVPALGWLLSKAIELGGFWLGLPYVVTTICVILATFAMFAFRIPPGTPQAPMRYHH